MSTFQPKDTNVARRAFEVQSLFIPFTVTHHATASSKTITVDEPALVFFNFQGITQISTATGALATSETTPSLASATDSTGVFNVLIKINEPLVKVCQLRIHPTDGATGVTDYCAILAFTTGGATPGQSVVANVTSGVNFSTTDLNACLEVQYITQE